MPGNSLVETGSVMDDDAGTSTHPAFPIDDDVDRFRTDRIADRDRRAVTQRRRIGVENCDPRAL